MASWLSIMNIWCEKFEVALFCCCYCCFDLLHQFVKIRFFTLLVSAEQEKRNWNFCSRWRRQRVENWENIYQKNVSLFSLSSVWYDFSSFWASLCSRHISSIDLSYACEKYQQSLESKQTAAVGRMSRMASFGFEYLLSSYHWAQKKQKESESTVISSTESQSSRLPPCHREPSFHLLYISLIFLAYWFFSTTLSFFPHSTLFYTLFSFANWRHKLLTQHPPDALNIYLIYMMMIHAETQWDVDDEKGK